MSNYNATIQQISNLNQAERAIQSIQSDPDSISIMAPKMVHHVIKLENIHLQDAIIIKQDMLSIGGEVAVPKHTFQLTGSPASILISGTIQQHQVLIEKLQRHYQRIRIIAEELNEVIQSVL